MTPRTPLDKAITVLMGSANGIQGARHAKYANSNIYKTKCKHSHIYLTNMEEGHRDDQIR